MLSARFAIEAKTALPLERSPSHGHTGSDGVYLTVQLLAVAAPGSAEAAEVVSALTELGDPYNTYRREPSSSPTRCTQRVFGTLSTAGLLRTRKMWAQQMQTVTLR
jgi:hypothetical protein